MVWTCDIDKKQGRNSAKMRQGDIRSFVGGWNLENKENNELQQQLVNLEFYSK